MEQTDNIENHEEKQKTLYFQISHRRTIRLMFATDLCQSSRD